MQQKFIDLIRKFNEVSVDTTKELMEINARAFEKYSQKQIETINEYLEATKKQLDAASGIRDIKDIPEYINAQTAEMQKCAETFYASAKETMEMIVQTTQEVNALMKKGMDTATSSLKSVSGQKVA